MRRKTIREQNPDRAFELNKELEKIEYNRRILLLNASKILNEIYETQAYKDILGDDQATWSAYLSQPNIFLSRNKLHKLFLVGKLFLKKLEIPIEELALIPLQRLVDILSVEIDDNILEEAKTLTPNHWKIAIRERKGLTTSENCSHNEETYKICRVCGHKTKQ